MLSVPVQTARDKHNAGYTGKQGTLIWQVSIHVTHYIYTCRRIVRIKIIYKGKSIQVFILKWLIWRVHVEDDKLFVIQSYLYS